LDDLERRIQGLLKVFNYPLLPQEGVKLYGLYIHGVHPNKSPFKILKKRERGHIQLLPIVLSYPYYLRNG